MKRNEWGELEGEEKNKKKKIKRTGRTIKGKE